MTDKKRQKIKKLAEKAIDTFLSYENICQEIERLLDGEKEETHLEVLYQNSDGLVVCVDRGASVDDNIPIETYLEELNHD